MSIAGETKAAMTTELRDLFVGMDVVVPDVTVTDITSDSRNVKAGGLFIACAGSSHHGLEFLPAVLEAGIRAVAWEPAEGIQAPALPAQVVGMRVTGLRAKLGVIADRYFSSPSAAIKVTGVTGTNGKTTTAWLVAQALNRLNLKTGYMGTLGFGIGSDLQSSEMTTPDCITVHRHLRELADAGAQRVIAEVSSHALDQHRIDGVRFGIAALTNLSRDHLDYHGSMTAYAEAKARLFVGSGIHTAVLNVGDRFGAEMAGRLQSGPELISVAVVDTDIDAPDARLRGRIVGTHAHGMGLALSGDFGEAQLDSALWGRFNAENLVMALGILLANRIDFAAAISALKDAVAPPGRMELIRPDETKPMVVVDFAHTPDALGKALRTVRQHTAGKIWCVFGCGGNRDPGKRRSMGEIAATLSDRMIVTDDNPRDEDPQMIADEIVAGARAQAGDSTRCRIIRDRKIAIETAIAGAAAEDVVLIAGKGHESVQVIGRSVLPFCDAAVVRRSLGRVE